jgi:restriction system protein
MAQLPTIDPSDADVRALTAELYDSFPTGEAFEVFLKLLLTRMGLQDVAVTRKTRDGGIDLTAMRIGLEELSHVDQIKYLVQAKRYSPERAVPIEAVRALRGVMHANEKGLFITTARFSGDTELFASQDASRPLVLIDGERLVRLCIDHHLGFRFKPVFDRETLAAQTNSIGASAQVAPTPQNYAPRTTPTFLKTVTANDIRARIISVPWEMGELIDAGKPSLSVEFAPHFSAREFQYRADRRYISGVTDVLRKFGLMTATGERVPRQAEWTFDSKAQIACVSFLDSAVP